ncbi:MAG: hypothetical protein NTV20_00405 [Candidatus Shapirobacteria bacterium]|nr:hypothetical protein [Candidatus Shapirobacteria bacterium]
MDFSWETLPDNFVLKSSKGFGGQGIMMIKRKAKWAGEWYLMDSSLVTTQDLRFHALEILSGRFSLHNGSDVAFIEERIKIQRIFAKYVWHGAPDIRVIVFNKVPVAAMLRLPTRESRGKSNLHQGAIGVGVDLATGITTHGVLDGRFIKFIPSRCSDPRSRPLIRFPRGRHCLGQKPRSDDFGIKCPAGIGNSKC